MARCLIVERYDWETGANRQQLQFVLDAAEQFFGRQQRQIRVHFFRRERSTVSVLRQISISRVYRNGTRRVNGFRELGQLPSCFLFFQERDDGSYDVWWATDKAIVVAAYRGGAWFQGHDNQHGRGRLAAIVAAPVPRNTRDMRLA